MPPKRKAATKQAEESSTSTSMFDECVFAIVGKFSTPQADIKKKIESAGGSVASSITKKVTHVISTQEAVNEGNAKLDKAIEDGQVKVITESFIDESIKNGIKQDETKYLISANAETKEKEEEKKEEEEKPKTKKAKTEEKTHEAVTTEKKEEDRSHIKKITIQKKGRAPVDSVCSVADSCHVLDQNGEVYDVMLNQTDIAYGIKGHNKFYVLQCLEKDGGGGYYVWTRWGRVGATGQFKLENFSNLQGALSGFEKKFKDKTGNHWSNKSNFKPVKGKYDMIEMDHGNDIDEEEINSKLEEKKKNKTQSNSKLDTRVQDLVKLLFDMKMFESTLLEMELDTKKMPLGKISKKQIQKGYDILEEIVALFKKSDNPPKSQLSEICSRFYTIIPHNFGMKLPPVISTKEELQQKLDLLEVLGDMEVAQKMIEAEAKQEDEHPFDAKYKLLENKIEPLDKNGEEWKRIEQYIENTRQHYKFQLLDVYKIARNGEADNFKDFDVHENRRLLWHGSKVAVFPAILSTGLRIMPHSGGRVGRGLYFADILAKSASYCGLHNNVGLLLLNEVVLGNIHKINRDDSSLVKAPKGFESVLATGTQMPDPKAEYVDKSLSDSKHPVTIPQGKIVNTGIASSFLHNEYLVYDAKQVNMKYLLMMKWN